MTDLVRSAIAIDDLSVIYRANLFTVSMRRAGSNGCTGELTDMLQRVYLNRDVTCLRCHNPTYSTSNKTDGSGNITWRRLWTVPGHPEKALFGNYYDALSVTEGIRPIMRGDVRKPVPGAFGTRPWGIGVSPDGRKVYTANGPSDDVSVIDVATGTVDRRIAVGGRPWGLVVSDR
jgi:YVTN family beta-propeller protein